MSGREMKRRAGEAEGSRTETVAEEGPSRKRPVLELRERGALGKAAEATAASTEQEALAALISLRHAWLPNLPAEELAPLVAALVDLLLTTKSQTGLRWSEQVVETLAELLKDLFASSLDKGGVLTLAEPIHLLLNSVPAPSAHNFTYIASLLTLLASSGALKSLPEPLLKQALEKAVEGSVSTSWRSRRESCGWLSLWATLGLGGAGREGREGLERVLKLLEARCRDAEARVRVEAMWGLVRVEEKTEGLPVWLYESVVGSLEDEEEEVRLLSLCLLPGWAGREGERRMEGKWKGRRLVDDAFCRLCHAVNDLSLPVRAKAGTLLGRVEGVGRSFLEQTLDKKLLTAMRAARQQRYGSGRAERSSEWSTGRRLGMDAPAEKAEEDSESLIPSGACGAFVTGLEDEFLWVREACVGSLSRLAARVPSVASKALHFLADMFNDEMSEVRLAAINSLRPLISQGSLSQDQMEIILKVLEDVSADSREALRELLCEARLPTVKALEMCLVSLRQNLKRFPADRKSIWRTLAAIGKNHPSLVLPLAPSMLRLHTFLDLPEQSIADPDYFAILVLVLNAAARDPGPLRALFPAHIWRHQLYLAHAHPDLVPTFAQGPSSLHLGAGDAAETVPHLPEPTSTSEQELLEDLYQRFQMLEGLGDEAAEAEVSAALLEELEELRRSGEEQGAAELLQRLWLARTELRQLVAKGLWEKEKSVRGWRHLWQMLAEMESFLDGGGPALDAAVAAFRLRLGIAALALCHKAALSHFPHDILRQALDKAQGSAQSERESEFLEKVSGELAQKAVSSERLLALLSAYPLPLPTKLSLCGVSLVRGWLSREAAGESGGGSLRPTAGLSVAAEVEGALAGPELSAEVRGRLGVEAVYPDLSREAHWPRARDWHGRHFSSRVLLSASLWTGRAPVRLSLVLRPSAGDLRLARAVHPSFLAAQPFTLPLPSVPSHPQPLQIHIHPVPR